MIRQKSPSLPRTPFGERRRGVRGHIDANLLYIHTIKPIDRELISEYSHTKFS